MLEDEKQAWFELTTYAVPNVLTQSENTVLELAAALLAEFRRDRAKFTAAKHGILLNYLAHLGMTPSARGKLHISKEKPKNPYSDEALNT